MSSRSRTPSNMDETLWSKLLSAKEREDGLISELQVAQSSMQELTSLAAGYKAKYQQLDDMLEAEQIKTDAERQARLEAEETVRYHRAEVSKLRRNETNANLHCEAAETEVINLQSELSRERSATVAASKLSSRLYEDLERASTNEREAYNLLEASKTKVRALSKDLISSTSYIKTLESELRSLESIIEREHSRANEAETTFELLVAEFNLNKLALGDLREKYNALEAKHSMCSSSSFVRTIRTGTSNSETVAAGTQTDTSTPIDMGDDKAKASSSSNPAAEPQPPNPNANSNSNTTTPPSQMIQLPSPPRKDLIPTLPTPPKPAILRPALATITADMFKPSAPAPPTTTTTTTTMARMLPRSPSSNTKNLRLKFLMRLPAQALELLCG